jgi:hypothetical protein
MTVLLGKGISQGIPSVPMQEGVVRKFSLIRRRLMRSMGSPLLQNTRGDVDLFQAVVEGDSIFGGHGVGG